MTWAQSQSHTLYCVALIDITIFFKRSSFTLAIGSLLSLCNYMPALCDSVQMAILSHTLWETARLKVELSIAVEYLLEVETVLYQLCYYAIALNVLPSYTLGRFMVRKFS